MNIIRTFLALSLFSVLTAACQESLEDRCQREAADYTRKHCPMRIDEFTVLDSMSFDKPTHTISYIYSLKGYADDSAAFNKVSPRELLLKEVKNSTQLKLYKEAGYSFRYVYYSTQRKGTRLFEATFHEKDYR